MASSTMPSPGGPEAPTRSPTTDATPPSTLAGNVTGDQPPPRPDQGMREVVQQLGEMRMTIGDIAGQFPAAASALRTVEQGLTAALRQIAENPGSPEPAAPQIGG